MGIFSTPDPTQLSTQPQWVTEASKDIYGRGVGVADIPYEPYPGERVAPLAENLQLASGAARAFQGEEFRGDYFDPARDLITGTPYAPTAVTARDVTAERVSPGEDITAERVGTRAFGQDVIDQYMSPFVKASLDPAAREKREASAIRSEELKRLASQRKAFGGSRATLLETEEEAGLKESIDKLYTEGLERAYQSAVGIFTTDEARKLQAAGLNQAAVLKADLDNRARALQAAGMNQSSALQAALANQSKDINLGKFNESQKADATRLATEQARALGTLGTQFSNVNTDIVNRLLGTGKVSQAHAQDIADSALREFEEARDYPEKQLDILLKTIKEVPTGGVAYQPGKNELRATVSGISDIVSTIDVVTGGAASKAIKAGGTAALGSLINATGTGAKAESLGLGLMSAGKFIPGATLTEGLPWLAGGAPSAGAGLAGAAIPTAAGAAIPTAAGAGLAGVGTAGAAIPAAGAGAGVAGVGAGAAGTAGTAASLLGFVSTIAPPLALVMSVAALGGAFSKGAKEKARQASSFGTVANGKLSFDPIKSKRIYQGFVPELQKKAQSMVSSLSAKGVDTSGTKLDVAFNDSGKEGEGQRYVSDIVNQVLANVDPASKANILQTWTDRRKERKTAEVKADKDKGGTPSAGFITVQTPRDETPKQIWFVNQTEEELLREMGVYNMPEFDISNLNLDAIMTKDKAFNVAEEIIQGSPNIAQGTQGAGLATGII